MAENLEQLLSERNIYIVCESPGDLVAAIRMAAEDGARPGDGNDYIIMASALNRGLALASYDKALRRVAAKRGLAAIPEAL